MRRRGGNGRATPLYCFFVLFPLFLPPPRHKTEKRRPKRITLSPKRDYEILSCATPPYARGDEVFWSSLSVNIDRPLTQLKKSLCSIFFGEPSSPLQPSREQNHSFPFSNSTLTTTIMSSNAPPTTTSPDRPSTNNSQDLLITPNHIPVVTQTEDNSPFEHLIRAIAITDHEHVSPSFYEDEMTHEQIPAASQTPNDTITTPIVNSPLKYRCNDRSSHLSAERDRRKNDGIHLFEANTASKRRKLNRVVPATTLLSFLRDNAINQHFEGYDGKIQDLSNTTIKAALNSWSSKSPIPFAPFKDFTYFQISFHSR
jgi:hypothetical protein